MTKEAVAIYWDFENLHASIFDTLNGGGSYPKPANRNRQQDVLVDVQGVYDFATTYGNVAINKAYCNWHWFSNYRQHLLKCAVELIQLFPPGAQAKNGADIKLSLDAMEDILRFPHISSIVVLGGDSDFIPLAQKLKAAGKDLIGVGCRNATNRHWANSCSDFKYYETFALTPENENPEEEEAAPPTVKTAVDLIAKAIKQISLRSGDKWVLKAAIRPVVKRLDPTFDEATYGCRSFADLLKKHNDRFQIERGQHDHLVCLLK